MNASSTFDLYFDVTLALAKEKKATSLYRAPSEGNQKEGRIRSASSKKQLLVVDLCTTLHNDSPFFSTNICECLVLYVKVFHRSVASITTLLYNVSFLLRICMENTIEEEVL